MGFTSRALRMAVAGLLAAGGAVVGAQPALAASADWAQEGFGAGNTSYNPSESVINESSIKKLRQRWTVTPTASDDYCTSATFPPVIAGGRVFMSEAGGVSAYDTKNGKKLWHHPGDFVEDGAVQLAVSGNTLVGVGNFCYSNSDSDGYIVAFDVKTGAHRWAKGRDTTFDTIVIDGGLVIGSGAQDFSDPANVTAYRLSDGTITWDRDHVYAMEAVSAGGRLLLQNAPDNPEGDGSVAVSAGTGATVWTSPTPWAVLSADPAGDTFYAASPAGALVALKATSGATIWSVKNGAGVVANDGRRVFVAYGSVLTAYDAKKGKKSWSKNLGSDVGRPVRAGGLVYATVDGGELAILKAATGKKAASGWTYAGYGRPLVTGGRLYQFDGYTLRTYTP